MTTPTTPQEATDAFPTHRSAAASLAGGAVIFAAWHAGMVVWPEGGVFGLDIPFVFQLAVHALMVVLLAAGLAFIARSVAVRAELFLAGAVLLPLGLVLLPPVLWAGIAALGLWALRARHRIIGVLLAVGAAGFIGAYMLGARVGTDNMPALSPAEAGLFLTGVAATAVALLIIALHAMGTTPRQDTTQSEIASTTAARRVSVGP